MRAAILTQPLGDRPACMYATPCMRGCAIRANFQSSTVLLPPALATGRLEIRPDCFVHGISSARTAVRRVSPISTERPARSMFVGGKVIVLAAVPAKARGYC